MFSLSVIALDKKIYEGQAKSLTVPGTEGELTILKDHIPLITSLKKGIVRVVGEKDECSSFEIRGGVLEVKPNEVIVLINP